MSDTSSFILTLKQAATRTTNEPLAAGLRHVARDLEDAILDLRLKPSANNLVRVNGLWAVGQRALNEANKGKDNAA